MKRPTYQPIRFTRASTSVENGLKLGEVVGVKRGWCALGIPRLFPQTYKNGFWVLGFGFWALGLKKRVLESDGSIVNICCKL